jgi:hypothetical protein
MKNLLLEVSFRSDEYSEACNIDKIAIEMADDDVANIKRVQEFLKENNFVCSAEVNIDGSVVYLDESGKEFEDWSTGYHSFKVYKNEVFYYAQGDNHSGDQIESQGFRVE